MVLKCHVSLTETTIYDQNVLMLHVQYVYAHATSTVGILG